ncbi:S-formylglutathione hydrolase [Allohahella marinimesophila]|uniref:S-formylglutathione hydrolase n=1 Tax=Allohahella marinimesophila TaxID=1054972 RepID=A0ABP7NMD2_9GAMM
MKLLETNRCFEGVWQRYSHVSALCQCEMTFSVYLPPGCESHSGAMAPGDRKPALLWLSGLTCTDQNFVQKAHAAAAASAAGCILLVPDTSPRGLNIDGEDERYDLGSGAGFYVDATESPWRDGYQMFSYITEEFLTLVAEQLPVSLEHLGVAGHSMGGHGALIMALKRPDLFRSVSAFAPICEPSKCDWGQRAFSAYLGSDQAEWAEYDACSLIRQGARGPGRIRVEQGDADDFLEAGQLRPESLQAVCEDAGIELEYQLREGYDHSYFFIQTFIAGHLGYHLVQLKHPATGDASALQTGLASR